MRTFATFNLCILSLLLCFNMITSLRSNNVLRPQISSMGVCYGNHVSVYTSHRRESTTRQWVQRPRPPTTPDRRWEVRPIGRIESPYVEKFGAPKQATILENGGGQAEGSIILFPGYEECLTSLEGFDYIWVISYLHRNSGFKTKIRPQPVANSAASPPQEVGLFASRAPHRPNPIGMSALQVVSVDVAGGVVRVRGLDLLHDTPVLDIKPYIPAFDAFPSVAAGWLDSIHRDSTAGREQGYQTIVSKRGIRAAKCFKRHEIATLQPGEIVPAIAGIAANEPVATV